MTQREYRRHGLATSRRTLMALFTKAEITSAYLKMGLMGFAGSGKTFTATDTAIGMIKLMREVGIDKGRPMFFLDTETGSDWVKHQALCPWIEPRPPTP